MRNLDLNWLLHPYERDVFFDRFFDSHPLHINREDPAYFEGLFSLGKFENLISKYKNSPFFNVKISNSQREVFEEEYINSLKLKNTRIKVGYYSEKIRSLFEVEHSAITLLDANNFIPPLDDLLSNISDDFQCRIAVEAKISPPLLTSLSAEYKVNDRVILQTENTSVFKVYDPPISRPISGCSKVAFELSNLKQIEEVKLYPGQAYYLPRGFLVQELPTRNISSQIIINIFNTTWVKVIIDLLNEMSHQESVLREGINVSELICGKLMQEKFNHIKKSLLTALVKKNLPSKPPEIPIPSRLSLVAFIETHMKKS